MLVDVWSGWEVGSAEMSVLPKVRALKNDVLYTRVNVSLKVIFTWWIVPSNGNFTSVYTVWKIHKKVCIWLDQWWCSTLFALYLKDIVINSSSWCCFCRIDFVCEVFTGVMGNLKAEGEIKTQRRSSLYALICYPAPMDAWPSNNTRPRQCCSAAQAAAVSCQHMIN